MSGNEVTKFDPATYVDKVRDKIKQSLIDVIPDEQWNTMLKAEISGFFESKTERPAYGEVRTTPSEFRRIVQRVLEEETRKRILETLNGPDWNAYWDGTRQQVGAEIGRIAQEHGAAIFSKWLESAIAQVITNIRFNQPQ